MLMKRIVFINIMVNGKFFIVNEVCKKEIYEFFFRNLFFIGFLKCFVNVIIRG